jgi:hypothetical protein
MIEVANPSYHKFNDYEANSEEFFKLHKPMLDIEHSQRKMSWGNAIRFYIMVLILFWVNIWIFIILPQNANPCDTALQADKLESGVYLQDSCTFINNGVTIFFYILFCVYFALVSLQIKYGLPELRRGSFAIQSTSKWNYYTFRVFLGIPFIFELRSIIDWTFTSTSLDVF